MDPLEASLLEAHEADDLEALVTLYTQAADQREAEEDVDATCFYLTHAYVFALERGDIRAPDLNKRLAGYGRAELLNWANWRGHEMVRARENSD